MKLLIVISLLIFTWITPTIAQCMPSGQAVSKNFTTKFKWHFLDFSWASPTDRATEITNGSYVPGNCMMSHLRFFNRKFYVILPKTIMGKTFTGCPVSLAWFSMDATNTTDTPLIPYPSFQWNAANPLDCTTPQSLSAQEISPVGNLWVMDAGRENPAITCSAQLFIISLSNNSVVSTFVFDDQYCQGCNFCNFVIEAFNSYGAYILDCSSESYTILYYNVNGQVIQAFQTSSMQFESNYESFTVNGQTCTGQVPISKIALTPAYYRNQPERDLYFTAGNGVKLYRVNTMIIRNPAIAEDQYFECHIHHVADKQDPSDEMLFDTGFNLYYGDLPQNSLASWTITPPVYSHATIAALFNGVWPNSFAIDISGTMYILANNKCAFANGATKIANITFYIVSFHTNTCDYQRVISEMNG